ncbi:hypothetical protein BFINE_49250 [Bacteroides finegoldii DSM 17565]|nr:hypothetical protein BFINE_49250 [Bacteroides finegoldii DSM 17565]
MTKPHNERERNFDIHWLQAEFQGGARDRANMMGQKIIRMAIKMRCATRMP